MIYVVSEEKIWCLKRGYCRFQTWGGKCRNPSRAAKCEFSSRNHPVVEGRRGRPWRGRVPQIVA